MTDFKSLANLGARLRLRFFGFVIGGLIGAFLGEGTGVVIGGGGGMRGLWVFLVLFGAIGLFAAPDAMRFWGWLMSIVRWRKKH